MTQFLYNNSRLKDRRKGLRCEQTEVESLLWSHLRRRQIMNLKFHRQFSVGPYILDFYCPEKRLSIEVDGSQHLENEQKAHDAARTAFLNSQNIHVLRFWNSEVLKNTEDVIKKIYLCSADLTPPSLPLF